MAEQKEERPTTPSDSESDEEDDDYPTWIQSIRSKTGLETGIEIDWPSSSSKLSLSTCLEPTDIAPMFDGTQWAGTRVWRASIVATQYLLQQYAEDSQEKTMLELGCGLGVPGMTLHAMRKWKVVLTDKDPLPKQLETNCKTNFEDGYGKSIQSHELDWSKEGVKDLMEKRYFDEEKFDIVLNCDCVYEPLYGLSWQLLLETIDELLRINPKTVMLTSLERRKADGVDKFLDAVDKSSHVSKVERIAFESEYPEVHLYRMYGVE